MTLQPWGPAEKENWLKEQSIKRSYLNEVAAKIEKLSPVLNVERYGGLSYNPELYPLYVVKSRNFDPNKKTVLITGGVHGYETSGVHGALSFMQNEAAKYEKFFNFVCFPCISPWGYETINRWNNLAIDPNRSFRENSPAEECRFFMEALKKLNLRFLAHFDLHETTDTDNSIFRPMLAKRDGKEPEKLSEIPDGFYLVGDTADPKPEFQKAIIDRVRKVTHISQPDEYGNLIGDRMEQEGVINYDKKKLFLCGGCTGAEFITTTEVYPDSPRATPEICVKAQVEAVKGGLDYLKTFEAVELRKNKKSEDAKALLAGLLKAFPEDPDINYQMAWTCDSLGHETQAVPFYEKAIAQGLVGGRAGAFLGLGSTLRALGRYDESLKVFDRAIGEFPEDRALKVFRALTLYNLGRAEESVGEILIQLLDTTGDLRLRDYERALRFYSDKLNQKWT